MDKKIVAISGIDTGIGKTIVTGLIARSLLSCGISVITQKMVQTGCKKISEDIACHRQLMECELMPEDHSGMSCPYIFTMPASPHLAGARDESDIDCNQIAAATKELARRFDVVLVEGAGGLAVPLTSKKLVADYIAWQGLPLILVTSPRLGSINHTLMSLEFAAQRKIPVKGLIYNLFEKCDPAIEEDSRKLFHYFLEKYGYPSKIIDLKHKDCYLIHQKELPDFNDLLT